MIKHTRPTWNEIFMMLASTLALRSTCNRAHVGCVLEKDNIPIAMGYNGSIRGRPHCDDSGHLMVNGSCKRTIHAERNAVINAAKQGLSISGATAYVTHFPCWDCFLILANAGIKNIIYDNPYRKDEMTDEQKSEIAESGINIMQQVPNFEKFSQ